MAALSWVEGSFLFPGIQCLLRIVVLIFLHTSALPLLTSIQLFCCFYLGAGGDGPGVGLHLYSSASPGRLIETVACLCIFQSPSLLPALPQGSSTRGYRWNTWT